MRVLLLGLLLFLAGCYDPPLKLIIFNNDINNINVITERDNFQIAGHTDKTMLFPNNIKPYTDDNRLLIKNGNCSYHYSLKIASLRTEIFDYVQMDSYEGIIKIQLNEDKKLYLVFPDNLAFPVDDIRLQDMQIKSFPVAPFLIECE